MDTILGTAKALADGATTSVTLLAEVRARVRDKGREGARVFLKLYDESAAAEAEAADRRRAAGLRLSPVDGVPISIKDLFDVAGETTMAGSVVRDGAPAAERDAAIVSRLRRAGAVIVGKTNMSEFAYSGLGLNPHYGTPLNPWDRETGRIPGGSSSGAAISITDDMAVAGIGTDTGGSVRIPAALCGLTGFKPTARRIPLDGCYPLSSTLDSIGPLAGSVACVAVLEALMAGAEAVVPEPIPLPELRLAVPQRYVLDDVDEIVGAVFETALTRLSQAGAGVVEIPFSELERLPTLFAKGGFAAAQAWAVHREQIAKAGERYDPRVAGRIRRGAEQEAADYIDLLSARSEMIAIADRVGAPFDALLMPTIPIVAPELAPLEADDELYGRTNLLVLRNSMICNFLDGCALTLPISARGEAPVGLTLMGEAMADKRILAISLSVEEALKA